MHRYLTVLWSEAHSSQVEAARRVLERASEKLPELRVVFRQPGICVLADRVHSGRFETYALSGRQGVVVGRLFEGIEEGAARRAVTFDNSESDAISRTMGGHLLERYWGRYVAFITGAHGDTAHILRDPSGAVQCFLSGYGGARIVFSRTEDLVRLGLVRCSINWRYVRACLLGRDVQSPVSGINEILQVRPGERVDLSADGSHRRTLSWNPMQISERDPIESFEAAADAAFRTTLTCVSAWASCYSGVLLRYSGGFDSTVVLASLRLASAKPRIGCLNYFESPADPREREYLRRAITGAAGGSGSDVELIEVPHAPEMVHLDQLLAVDRFATLPQYRSCLMIEPFDRDLAGERGSALFDGLYGDQLFLTDRSLLALDYVWRHSDAAAEFGEESDLSTPQVMVWSALAAAMQMGFGASRRPALVPSDYPYLSEGVIGGLDREPDEYLRSYWRQHSSQGVPPGKRAHISMMCMPADMNRPFDSPDSADRVTPLISQPLMELFLRIPTYVLNAGRLDRSVERHAFRSYLPQELLATSMVEVGRSSRYGSDQLTVFRRNQEFTRQVLLDGRLAKEKLLDRNAVDRYLRDFADGNSNPNVDILETYFDLEIWLESWKSAASLGSAAEL